MFSSIKALTDVFFRFFFQTAFDYREEIGSFKMTMSNKNHLLMKYQRGTEEAESSRDESPGGVGCLSADESKTMG